jgi:hypothetical protein
VILTVNLTETTQSSLTGFPLGFSRGYERAGGAESVYIHPSQPEGPSCLRSCSVVQAKIQLRARAKENS